MLGRSKLPTGTWKIVSIVLAGMLTGCAQQIQVIDPSTYPPLPMPFGTKVMRRCFETDPFLQHFAVYGNYGGPGGWGGEPVDPLDACFYRHDLAYSSQYRLGELLEADRVLIADLRDLDLDTLNPDARRYRKKALFYMRTPFAFFSKPINVWIGSPPKNRVVIADGDR